MAASAVAIANQALQKLGLGSINSLTQNDPKAAAMSLAYASARQRMLRKHRWHFAISRASVAADADDTTWGGLNRYQLPNDFLRLIRDDESGVRRDWKREGRFIVTADASPLEFRYIADVVDTTLFDPLFDDALAVTMALQACHVLTGSNGIKQELRAELKEILAEAKRVNAYELDAEQPLDDDWINVRI